MQNRTVSFENLFISLTLALVLAVGFTTQRSWAENTEPTPEGEEKLLEEDDEDPLGGVPVELDDEEPNNEEPDVDETGESTD